MRSRTHAVRPRSITHSNEAGRRGLVLMEGFMYRHHPDVELENMADAITGVALPLLDRDDALGEARLIGAHYRSDEEGAVTPV